MMARVIVILTLVFASVTGNAAEEVDSLKSAQLLGAFSLEDSRITCGFRYEKENGADVYATCRMNADMEFIYIRYHTEKDDGVFVDIDRGDDPLPGLPMAEHMEDFSFWVSIYPEDGGHLQEDGDFFSELLEPSTLILVETTLTNGGDFIEYDPQEGVDTDELRLCLEDENGNPRHCSGYDERAGGFDVFVFDGLQVYGYTIWASATKLVEGEYDATEETEEVESETIVRLDRPGDVRSPDLEPEFYERTGFKDGRCSFPELSEGATLPCVVYHVTPNGGDFWYYSYGYGQTLKYRVYRWQKKGDMVRLGDSHNDYFRGEDNLVLVVVYPHRELPPYGVRFSMDMRVYY